FHDVVSALAYSLAAPHAQSPELGLPYNDLTRFILTQRAQMPDYLRAPMKLAALGFDWSGVFHHGKPFHTQAPEQRARQINAWKNAGSGFKRDLIRYFESLALFSLYSRPNGRPSNQFNPDTGPGAPGSEASELRAEVVV